MENRMNYDDFAPDFGPWAEKFRPFIESEEMFKIYQQIKEDRLVRKQIIVPTSDKTFRTFKTTDPSNIKVIFYLMDPYPRMYKGMIPQATGIALDCSNSPDGKLQPSLEHFYKAIEAELDKKVQHNADLTYLHKQGVMMLNTDLTCKFNKTGSHEKLWEPFQKYFLEEIMSGYSGIIYVLCGKSSHRMKRYIYGMGNYIFEIEHPNVASHGQSSWDSKGVFNKINRILAENNGPGSHIFWDKLEYETNPPF